MALKPYAGETLLMTAAFTSILNPLLLFTCPAVKASPCSGSGIVLLSPSLSVCLTVCLAFVLAPSERWHWETAVTWDAFRSWQGLGKLRQKGGRGPLSETRGTDLPQFPLHFSLPFSCCLCLLASYVFLFTNKETKTELYNQKTLTRLQNSMNGVQILEHCLVL